MIFNSSLNLNSLTPKKLSFIILGIGIVVSSIISYPMSQVFAGNWKLNQTINIAFIENVNLFGAIIPIGQISIRYYALFILFGMLSGYAMAIFLSKWHYIAGTVVDRLFIGLVIFGIVGARAFYVLFNLDNYVTEPLNAFLIFRGGLAIFGMILACLIYIWAYTSRFKFNFFEFLDFLAPSVLIGQIIGRFGNFFNYESYGGPTKVFWKMFVPETANVFPNIAEQFFHPTFLYEIIPNFILLILILFNYEKLTNKRSGLVFAVYAIGYGVIRTITEFFRLDALTYNLPENLHFEVFNTTVETILVSQLAAISLILFGGLIFFFRRKTIFLKRTMAEISV
jgi:phosphatidylglycerol:prolipoprotein diacylglycerol transferase